MAREGTARWWQDRRRHLLALALLALCTALLWASERGRSPTADEPLHLVRGHALWWTHETKLSYAHPPLANAITSLPHAGEGDEPWGTGRDVLGEPRPERRRARAPEGPELEQTRAEALQTLSGWEIAEPLNLSSAYFRHDLRRAREELRDARRVMMLWTLALGMFIYLWVERRYTWTAAIVSLALFALHPTLLAHGRLATTDMPLAATSFVSLAALIAWIERPSWGRVALFGLASTAMVLSKHSGLAFVVIMSFIVLGAAILGRGGFAGDRTRRGRARRGALVAGQLALVALAMIVAIDAAYLFDRVGLSVAEILAEPEPHNWISKKHDHQLLESSALASLPEGLRLPFPYTWLAGLATVSEQNALGHGRYFFGLHRSAGHPLYFPVMLVAKTPTGMLVLLGAGLWLAIARARAGRKPSLTTTVLCLFAAVVLASACASRINIGVRHVLPLMPIMIVLAGRSADLLLATTLELPSPPAWLAPLARRRALVAACLLGTLVGAAWTFPTYLGDFSLAVGGPVGGHRISVIGEDWGQDLDDAAELAHEQGWDEIVYYSKFPLRREVLESHGLSVDKIDCDEPWTAPGPIFIHLSDWARRRRSCFSWLSGREPDFVVNHHLLVFVNE